MNTYEKISNHVSTLILNDDVFQSIKLDNIPDGWEYTGINQKNEHTFKHKWKFDFKSDVLIPLIGKGNINSKHAEMYDSFKKQKVIDIQKDHRIYCSKSLGIVGTSAKTSFDDVYKRMVEMGICKDLDEAKRMYHNVK